MKAIVYRTYGSPNVLHAEETATATPTDDQVLIRVRAASVNPYDWHVVRASPYIMRLLSGLIRPKDIRVGVDVAGVVETVGSKVTRFTPGDAVFGGCRGAFAEYACAAETSIVAKPANVTFEQAATVAIAGYTALQGLRDHGEIQRGHHVLVNGASGGASILQKNPRRLSRKRRGRTDLHSHLGCVASGHPYGDAFVGPGLSAIRRTTLRRGLP